MSFQKVEAGRGVEWIKQAFSLLMANPGVLLVGALILGVLSAIPILNLVMVVIAPALCGGLIYAMREQDRGGTPEVGQVFAAFQQQGKIGPMLLLCLPALIGGVVLVILMFIFGGAAIMAIAAGASGSTGAGAAGMGGIFLVLIFAIAIGLFVAATTFHAIPRVMLDGIEPFAAMKESLSASLANIGAMLLYWVIVFVVFLVLGLVIGWIPILGGLVLFSVYYGIYCGAAYAAYKDLFGSSIAPVDYMPPPPAPPPL